MGALRIGFIGVGLPRGASGASGMGMAYEHAAGHMACEECEIVAAADIRIDSAMAFASRHPGTKTYDDHRKMLEIERPDVVSVCVWTPLHASMVMDCIASGVRVVHCEKPMAATFGEARQMVEAAEHAGAQLTFHHQRRFNPAVLAAREILEGGALGPLLRMESSTPNLFDRGTHFADLLFAFNGQAEAEWVIGQIEIGAAREVYGIAHESQGLAQARFRNGVHATVAAGDGASLAGCKARLICEGGSIEVGREAGPLIRDLRWRQDGRSGWEERSFETGHSSLEMSVLAIREIVDSFRQGRRPTLDGRNALQAAELTFAIYESSRRRGRVDLPLDIEDSPLRSMIERVGLPD